RQYLSGKGGTRNPAKAAEILTQTARAGDVGSMILLAKLYATGDGVSADFEQSRSLLEAAIAGGAVKDGSRALGDLYRTADPPHRNPDMAMVAYQKAVDLGDAGAMIALAQILGKGDGTPVSFDRARALLEKAVAAGEAIGGWESLGDLYRNAAPDKRDPRKAEDAYQKAVELGDPWAMLSLADMLANGDGLPVDFDRARKLLEGAAGAGEVKAAARALGDLYRYAAADKRDPAKAAGAYQKAAELGDTGAMLTLANMLAKGDGVAVDFDRARSLLEGAIAAGRTKEGSRALGDLYRNADAPNRDTAKAAVAYQRAVDLGD